MELVTIAISLLTSASIPSVIVTRMVKRSDKRAEEREKRAEEREKARIRSEMLVFRGTDAALALSTATATELDRYGHVNGDTKEALKYATHVKHEMKDFYVQQGVEHLA